MIEARFCNALQNLNKGTIVMECKPLKTFLVMRVNGGGKPFTMKATSERQVKRQLGRKSLNYLIQEVIK